PAPRLGVDAGADLLRLPRCELVGVVVPGCRARRRRVRRPADLLDEERAPRAARGALVQHRPLRAPPVALDYRGARLDGALSGPRGSRVRLREGHGGSSAAVLAWLPDRRVLRGLHVDDLDAAQ